METTFTLDDLPNVTFTVQRGAGDDDTPEVPSNWLTIVGIDTAGVVVTQVGFAGP